MEAVWLEVAAEQVTATKRMHLGPNKDGAPVYWGQRSSTSKGHWYFIAELKILFIEFKATDNPNHPMKRHALTMKSQTEYYLLPNDDLIYTMKEYWCEDSVVHTNEKTILMIIVDIERIIK